MSEERPVPPGWNASRPDRLPQPTAWPPLFAFGVMIFFWGVVSSPLLILIGGVFLLYAFVHWIGEIRHDAKQR